MMHAALFLSLILSSNPAPLTQSCALPGLWLGHDRNQDAVGMWLEFAPDGSVVRASGKIIDGGWELKGSDLTLSTQTQAGPEGDRASLTQRVKVKVEGDQMTRRAEAAILEVAARETRTSRGTRSTNVAPEVLPAPPIAILDEQTLSRVVAAEASQPAIIGVWGHKNKAGRPVLERYSAARRFAVLEPVAAQRGTFSVAGNKLAVTADGATTEVPILCGRESFELEVGGGKMRFVKFQ
jgi:hypothetical protein